MEGNKSDIYKKQLLLALEKTMGIASLACKKVGISRKTYYEYYNNDPEFKENVDLIGELGLDFTESQLFKSIKNGSDTAIIFYLKTKGKKRGYIERIENENRNTTITIKVDGEDE